MSSSKYTTLQADEAREPKKSSGDKKQQQQLQDDAVEAADATVLRVPLFLAQPVVGLTAWDQVMLGAMQQRDAAVSAADLRAKTEKKLSKQLVKQHEDLRKDLDQHRAAKDAALSRVGKAVSRAVDKCWGRSKRGYEAMCATEVDIEKQRSAEKRQERFLQDTRKLTDFLVDSLNSLMHEFAVTPSGEQQQDGADDGGGFETKHLTLLNTLGGRRNLRPYQREGLKFLLNVFNNDLNCILADEPGLGKTIATLSLFAYFAEHKSDWGPHLVVVPASILANWQLECMRWTPGFKVIAYHGTAKERANLRKGWTAENAFHICIASYSTVLADRNVFKRRAWGFLVLDEAHQIKNTHSQAWQVLYELNCTHRLLLTGTPLQTSEMELWSLLRFIIPPHVAIRAAQRYLSKDATKSSSSSSSIKKPNEQDDDDPFAQAAAVAQQQQEDGGADDDNHNNGEGDGEEERSGLAAAFQNVDDFQRWFSDPLTAMVSGQSKVDAEVVTRLQTLLRPFFFRREKKQVEKDLPSKREVVVMCPLSRRQRALYQDFLALADTRSTLERGQYRDVVRILLSLRKVCDHPDLFAERPVASPLVLDPQLDRIVMRVPRAVFLNDLAHFSARQRPPWWSTHSGSTRHRVGGAEVVQLSRFSSIRCGERSTDQSAAGAWTAFSSDHWNLVQTAASVSGSRSMFLCHVDDVSIVPVTTAASGRNVNIDSSSSNRKPGGKKNKARVVSTSTDGAAAAAAAAATSSSSSKSSSLLEEMLRSHLTAQARTQQDEAMKFFAQTGIVTSKSNSNNINNSTDIHPSLVADHGERVHRVVESNKARGAKLERCSGFVVPVWLCDIDVQQRILGDEGGLVRRCFCPSAADHIAACKELLSHVVVVVPKVWARLPLLTCALALRPACDGAISSSSSVAHHPLLSRSRGGTPVALSDPHDLAHYTMTLLRSEALERKREREMAQNRRKDHGGRNSSSCSLQQRSKEVAEFEAGWSSLAHHFHFPDRRWVLQDCGKFFVLFPLFKRLKAQGHRVLIFTQFTAMLGILERFLAFMGLVYLRLDSTLKPDERQFRVERFNRDDRIFAMVLSTRSGGVGLNLIGADTVVFIDSDWNPAMDLQAQDRCHRIGQTRDVTIYRLVSEHTVEARILKKARQRQMLNNLIIRSGKFNENLDEWQKRSEGSRIDGNAIRSFFHEDEDDAGDDLGLKFGEEDEDDFSADAAAAAAAAEQENGGDDSGNNNNNNNNNNIDGEWLQATRDVEDEEDRVAGTAAAEEQRKITRGDFLEQSTLMDMVREAKEDASADDGNNKIRFRTTFGSCATESTSWPPLLNREPAVNVRLCNAVKNATSSGVEAWGAMALPFFGRSTAEYLKQKAVTSVSKTRGKRAAAAAAGNSAPI